MRALAWAALLLAGCRSPGYHIASITVPAAGQGLRPDVQSPDLAKAAGDQPLQAGKGQTASSVRPNDDDSGLSQTGGKPDAPTASTGTVRSEPVGAREGAQASASKEGGSAASVVPAPAQPAGQGPAEGGLSTQAQAAAAGAISAQRPDGQVQAPGSGSSRRDGKRAAEVPEQDLTHRPFLLRAKLAAGPPPPSGGAPSTAELAADDTPPPLMQLDMDMAGSMQLDTMLVGAYRIQMSTAADFGRLLFDKVYDFMEDPDVFGDIATLRLRRGTYWVRYAEMDLLGAQHPYSRPRAYSYRPPAKKAQP